MRALAEIENALSGIARQRERSTSLTTAVESARLASERVRQLYLGGDFNDVLDAEKTRLRVEDNLAVSRAQSQSRLSPCIWRLAGGAGRGHREAITMLA